MRLQEHEPVDLAEDEARQVFVRISLAPEALQPKVLARVAGLLQSGYLTDRLSEAKTESQAMEIIKAADVAATL